jgi:hypothetical protein
MVMATCEAPLLTGATPEELDPVVAAALESLLLEHAASAVAATIAVAPAAISRGNWCMVFRSL